MRAQRRRPRRVPPLDAHELDLNYGEEFPADAFARNLSRAMPAVLLARGADREAAVNRELIDYLLRAADNQSLTKGNMTFRAGLPNMGYPSMNYFNAVMVALTYVSPVMTDGEKSRVYEWLAPMIELIVNSRWADAVDNKAAYRSVVEAFWGRLTDNRALIRKAEDNYRFGIRYMRPDGTFARDASRGGSSGHYTTIHMADLIMIASLDAMGGGKLFEYEVDGRSIHTAVGFYLDFAEDPVGVNGRYAKACEDGSMGTLEAPSVAPWKVNLDRGGETLTAMRLYALFNPDHPNTARFRQLLPDLDQPTATWDRTTAR